METNSKKNEIINIALDLQKSGKTWREVAQFLSQNGYTNLRGKPYTEGGIWTIVTLATDPVYRARVTKTKNPIIHSPRSSNPLTINKTKLLDLRKSIISLDGVDAGQKLSLLEQTFGL